MGSSVVSIRGTFGLGIGFALLSDEMKLRLLFVFVTFPLWKEDFSAPAFSRDIRSCSKVSLKLKSCKEQLLK